MTNELNEIANKIKSKIPFFDKFFLEARRDEEGRVTLPIESNGNELTYTGITDNEGNFFYIRFREDFIFYEELNEKSRFSACETFVEKRIPFRLVTVSTCSDSIELEKTISSILFSHQVERSTSIKSGRVVLRQSLVDSYSVLREESKNPKKFDKFLKFVAIDFDLVVEWNQTCSFGQSLTAN